MQGFFRWFRADHPLCERRHDAAARRGRRTTASAAAWQSANARNVARSGACAGAEPYSHLSGSSRIWRQLKPAPSSDHGPYAKRAMARDMIELMTDLGHRRFSVLSHDRGARVAHRLALDFPDQVERLVVMDIIPTIEHFERTDMAFALGYYHWFWFAQPHPFPEQLINATPDLWWYAHTRREPKGPEFFHPAALADYLTAAREPATISGMCEDYRAATTIDLVDDRESREQGKRIQCPLLVLWGAKGKIETWYDPLAVWRNYASGSVDGRSVNSGHYLAEEAPEEVLAAVLPFLT